MNIAVFPTLCQLSRGKIVQAPATLQRGACTTFRHSPRSNPLITQLRHTIVRHRRDGRPSLSCQAKEEPPWVRQDSEVGQSGKPSSDKKLSETNPQDKKGQRTAIITGFISVAFGVLYLLLVSFLDSRGSVLHPPPPEAFGL